MISRTSIPARAGRWSAKHRKTAIFGWLAFVVVAFMLGGSLGVKTLDQYHGGTGESGRADELLGEKFEQPATERVLVQGSPQAVRSGARISNRLMSQRREDGSVFSASVTVTPSTAAVPHQVERAAYTPDLSRAWASATATSGI